MSATRLPGKPLLKINGLSIISHVSKKAEEANIGDVIVATEDQEIIDDVRSNGFNAILTSNKHKTGTDRIHEALKKSNIRDVDFIMNLQGDEPAIDIQDIVKLNDKMLKNPSNIGTLAAKMKDYKNLRNENIVKVITENTLGENNFPKSISFLRQSEQIDNIYHHIGVYCYSKRLTRKICFI
jgi:CMP-2-keto-3-deoxyoctulosonic acid synthetase